MSNQEIKNFISNQLEHKEAELMRNIVKIVNDQNARLAEMNQTNFTNFQAQYNNLLQAIRLLRPDAKLNPETNQLEWNEDLQPIYLYPQEMDAFIDFLYFIVRPLLNGKSLSQITERIRNFTC